MDIKKCVVNVSYVIHHVLIIQKYSINFNAALKISVKPGDSNKKEISVNEFPLLKSVLESEYFRMIARLFEKETSDTTVSTNTTEKVEVGCNNKIILLHHSSCTLHNNNVNMVCHCTVQCIL